MIRLFQVFESISVNPHKEVDEIVNRLSKFNINLKVSYDVLHYEDNVVMLDGCFLIDEFEVTNLDKMILELTPFIAYPQLVRWQLGRQHGVTYLGPPDKKNDTISGYALEKIKENIPVLVPSDLKELQRTVKQR